MPVMLLAVYLEKGDRATFPAQHSRQGGGFQTRMSFDTVRLWEHRDRIVSGEWAELAPLLVLCEERPTEATVQQERALIEGSGLPRRVQTELKGVALLVASQRFPRGMLRALFEEDLAEMSAVDELKELFYEAGVLDRWLRDSRLGEEMRETAKQEGQESLLLRQLQRKFGPVSPALQDQVHALSADALLELAEALLDFTALEEVKYWMSAHSAGRGVGTDASSTEVEDA
jgi:hypothetical protein